MTGPHGPDPAEPQPPPGAGYPACPHCGGGPLVPLPTLGGTRACRSCARTVSRQP
jgi:hypothetical protein